MIMETLLEWDHLTESISKFHEMPVFLPQEWILQTLLPTVAAVAVSMTTVYFLAFQWVDHIVPPNSSSITRARICYQITNAVFNIAVGCVGLYQEIWVLPTLAGYQGTHLDRIAGEQDTLYLVSAMQLGYQCWALPVGVLFVGETTQMILHHIGVVVSASFTGFMTVGFRYYTPFFYGVTELSSVPLALMNTYKDNPDWIKKDPTVYKSIRVFFAISFLYLRIVLCALRWPVFLRDNFIYMYTRPMGLFKLCLLVQISLAVFLLVLQVYWAYLIIKGLLIMFWPAEETKEDSKAKKKE